MPPHSTDCQVKDGKRWMRITIGEVLRIKKGRPQLRCLDCGRPVRPFRKGTNSQAPHFKHVTWNRDCSRRDLRVPLAQR